MFATTHRRLLVPLLAAGASLALLTGCGSDDNGGSPIVGGSSSASSPATTGGSVASVTASSSGGAAAGSSETSSGGSSDGGDSTTRSVAAFCKAYDLDVVKNAGSDPKAALAVLKNVAATAPEAIRADAELIYNALNAATTGKTGDISKIRDASASVARYYVQNCN